MIIVHKLSTGGECEKQTHLYYARIECNYRECTISLIVSQCPHCTTNIWPVRHQYQTSGVVEFTTFNESGTPPSNSNDQQGSFTHIGHMAPTCTVI